MAMNDHLFVLLKIVVQNLKWQEIYLNISVLTAKIVHIVATMKDVVHHISNNGV